MPRRSLSYKLTLTLSLLLLPVMVAGGCRSNATFDSRLGNIVSPYRFSIFKWEVKALSQEIDEVFSDKDKATPDQARVVVDYFDIMSRINAEQQAIEAITSGIKSGDLSAHQDALDALEQQRDALTTQAERVLESQLRVTLNSLGIYNPLDSTLNLTSTFPPVKLRLQEPPKLLVVSPRGNISRLTTVTLNNNLSLDNISKLEDSVSGLDVSALVVDLGGIATYPSFVANRYGLRFALSTAVEEWLHQYFFFRPLGFRYGLESLGFHGPDYIATMNETLAGMVSHEVADIIYDTYYASFYPPVSSSGGDSAPPTFNFNSFMRNTRLTVDSMLAQGQITQAEAYMEQQRLILASHGYLIRKLNQAFFAFYGSYADQPGFENPIADNLKALRAKSATLAAFVEQASGFTNPDELARAAG
ncbi:MAG: hypothetical protein C4542_07825 [Dehalococcoidia bacterium]|nr:MAG: hypothetical protein C4542_07825 [Dehalococcoidia bacterium]